MRAITLHQPWASLIALGEKRIETRSWGTDYRGLLAIHAAITFSSVCRSLCWQKPFSTVLVAHGIDSPVDLPCGAVLCVVELYNCLPIQDLAGANAGEWTTHELDFGNYRTGPFTPRFAWLTRNLQRLSRPIAWRGARSLWPVPADLLSQIESGLPALLPQPSALHPA